MRKWHTVSLDSLSVVSDDLNSSLQMLPLPNRMNGHIVYFVAGDRVIVLFQLNSSKYMSQSGDDLHQFGVIAEILH